MADKTKAQIGSKTALSVWDLSVSPVVYTDLGPILSIDSFGVSRPEVESTTLDSSAVERIAGLPDGKQVKIKFTAAASSVDKIEGYVNAGDPIDLKLAFPAPLSKVRYFTVVPLDYDHGSITPKGLHEITLMGRITGSVVAIDPHA